MTENSLQERELDWTQITDLEPDLRSINVRFTVTEKGSVRQVRSNSTGRLHEVCDIAVADDTGSARMTLWNEDISGVLSNESYELLGGYVRLYDECMILSKGRSGLIRNSQSAIKLPKKKPDMSRPFAWKPERKRKRSARGRSFQGRPGREAKGYCSRKSF